MSMTTTQAPTIETDKVYNVRVVAFDYIEAASAEEALATARQRLERAHFDASTSGEAENNAIPEDVPAGTMVHRRGFRVKTI